MNHQHAPLPEHIAARLAIIEAELDEAEHVQLATASNADLIVRYERLRGTCADLVRLVKTLM